MNTTKDRWRALCQRLGAKDNQITGRAVDSAYDELIKAYTGPTRHYHDLIHINEGLAEIDKIRDFMFIGAPDILEAAWWCHDFVYEIPANKNENELRSAMYAFRLFLELDVPRGFLAIFRRIMATTHDFIPESHDDKVIVDIDLIRLASHPNVLRKYEEELRREYGVTVEEFELGRARFFQHFMKNRPSVYLTHGFRKLYEQRAQENIARALALADAKSKK